MIARVWLLGAILMAALASHAQKAPQRIVSLAPSCAEIAATLGLGDALVGVTSYTDWPARAKQLPQVGSYVKINVEAVLALKPDLVLATDDGNPPATLRQLERLGIRVVTLQLRNFNAIQQSILALGRETGREGEAQRAVQQMRTVSQCVAQRTRNVRRPRVLFAYQLGPIVSPGKGTFTNELVAMAGADSITTDVAQPYPRMSIESVIARAPEVIIVSSMDPKEEAARTEAWFAKWPPIPAVRNDRVHLMDSTNLDRPSQRVVYGLLLLARTIHPTLFARGECAAGLGE